MNNLGKVIETFSAQKGFKGDIRPIVDELKMIKGYGIEKDKFAGKNPQRSVMIVGLIAYEMAKEKNIELKYGSLGENILLECNPHKFNIDDIIQIGTVKLQITQECSICSHLSVHDDELPKLIEKYRGVYCKVLNDGIIKKGQYICKL